MANPVGEGSGPRPLSQPPPPGLRTTHGLSGLVHVHDHVQIHVQDEVEVQVEVPRPVISGPRSLLPPDSRLQTRHCLSGLVHVHDHVQVHVQDEVGVQVEGSGPPARVLELRTTHGLSGLVHVHDHDHVQDEVEVQVEVSGPRLRVPNSQPLIANPCFGYQSLWFVFRLALCSSSLRCSASSWFFSASSI